MKYFINDTIIYKPAAGTLFSPGHTLELLHLVRISNELLQLLIEHNQRPLSREFLLYELWEKHGLSASSNNLNNYISMLRKALAHCGYPALITTIPKHGFLFAAESVVAVENDESAEWPQPEIEPPLAALPAPETRQAHADVLHAFLPGGTKLIAFTLMLLLAIASLPSVYHYLRLLTIRTDILHLDQCHFYLADDKTRRMDNANIVNIITMIANNEKLNCTLRANVYYFADKKKDASGHTIMNDLLSYCPYNSKAPCDNYYLSKHEDENEN